MKFLTFVWSPFLIWTVWMQVTGEFDSHDLNKAAAASFVMFLLLGIALLVTFVYALTRVFRRASKDSMTR